MDSCQGCILVEGFIGMMKLVGEIRAGYYYYSWEKLINWSSMKQNHTSLSTTEAEYLSISDCCAQVLWMKTQLTVYGFFFDKISIYCDSRSTISISFNTIQHSRTKHIAVRFHFINEHVDRRNVELHFVKTEY